MIELVNIGMSFEGTRVLQNISLQIGSGENFVIIGPSGHGKSVLLKIMSGVLTPTEGEVYIDGQNLHALNSTERQNLIYRMGMLFQKNALFDSLKCGENIAFPLVEVRSMAAAEVDQKVEHFLEAVEILHAKDLYPDEISGGMQKRLGIARALALDPEIIFYDDPTAGLDPITSRTIIRLILDLQKKRGATVVSITNDMMRAYQMADRIGMVVDGGLIVTGNQEETLAHKDPRVVQFVRGERVGPLTELNS